MFSQPRIEKVFSQYVTVQLHVPPLPAGARQVPDAEGARQLRDDLFQNYALPYYVVIRPRGKTLYRVAYFEEGVIKDPEQFANFLEEAAKVKVP